MQNLDEALRLGEAAAALHPESAAARAHLGGVLAALGRHADALAHLDAALALDPANAEAHNNRGACLQLLGDLEAAAAAYRSACAIRPGYIDAMYNLGNALAALGHAERAVEAYRAVIALEPRHADAYANMGTALEQLGQFPESIAAYEKAVSLEPRSPRLLLYLAGSKKTSSAELAIAEGLAREMASLSAHDQAYLHFALAKAYRDAGSVERSFRHLLEGNARERTLVDYDEASALDGFDRIARTFTAAFIERLTGQGDPSDVPVFIIGMPRSGTTLIEQILASHPGVYGAGELPAFDRAVRTVITSSVSGPVPAERVAHIDAGQIRRIGERYLAGVAALAPEASRITDKMPSNFIFTGLIALALPNARIIHARRDPVDTCLSCFEHLFAGDQPWAYDLGELGRYYRAYETLMRHWQAVLAPGTVLDVRYEDVVADLEGQARRIVAHCGLEWSDACLEFHQARRPVQTASATQVRQPIYRTSIGRWRPYAHLLQPLLDALGDAVAHP